jgi:3'(2'), 5'-bisphosphate nucleotidase
MNTNPHNPDSSGIDSVGVNLGDLTETERQVVEVSRLAGAKILELFLPEIAVTHKDDETPLTAADLAANKLIIEQLKIIAPALPVITEESCAIPHSERSIWSTYWLVDPLDGTREFIKQHGEFSVNIALIHNRRPVLGVVHAPILDTTYWASKGSGAWKQLDNDEPRKIHVRKAPEQRVTVAMGWSSQIGPKLGRFLDNLGEHSELRMGGALKSCLVAEGRADIYACLGPTGEWDTAAAQCIVEEAGGQITDTCMNTLQYNTRDSLLNPDFFAFGCSERRWSDYLK